VPEGPEVRRAADRVERAAAGGPVRLESPLPALVPHLAALGAAGLDRVETHGKAAILRFGDGRGIYVHLQLYGRWRFQRTPPGGGRALRLALHGPRSAAWLLSATDIALLERDELHPFVESLGPDPLHPRTDAAALAATLDRAPRRALGAVLLDQRRIAGLGNYLRADLLWEAELAPTRAWASLDGSERERLLRAILEVPRRSLRSGGVTTPEPWLSALRAAGAARRALRHPAYHRAGRPCHRCAAAIVVGDVGGRSMFWCPGCQA
jgi:endonuclease-8